MKKHSKFHSSCELVKGNYYTRKGFNFHFEDREGNIIVLNLNQPVLFLGRNEVYSKFLCVDRIIYCYNKLEKVFILYENRIK